MMMNVLLTILRSMPKHRHGQRLALAREIQPHGAWNAMAAGAV